MSDKRPAEGASNDLPAKLRDIGRWAVEAKGVEVVYEAADEIERLRAEVTRLEGEGVEEAEIRAGFYPGSD